MAMMVSYGGGLNSTAMLVGMVNRGERQDAILFADTGGERPDVYAYAEMFSKWLVGKGFPEITVVANLPTLEQDCITRKALPSVAYGFKSCSDRWKLRPQNRWVNRWPLALEAWERGEKVVKCIGFDAEEPYRAEGKEGDDKYLNRYPLIEWNVGRAECAQIIAEAGLPPAAKSSCFFCPNTKRAEIRQLRDRFPDLLARAIAMEENAELTEVAGLGRGWSWKEYVYGNPNQPDLFTPDMPCGCYDGD